MPAVLCVGRLYCDLIFTGVPRLPTLGTEVFTKGFGAHAGGGAFITAAHLAQLGHLAHLGAMLPAAPFRDLIDPDLIASGVDVSLSENLPEQAGPQITVAMVQDADRSFLTHRSGPAFPRVSPQQMADHRIKHLHIGEIASLIEHPDILDLARSQGATISADCGWDDDFDPESLRPLIGTLDVFLPNQSEMELLDRYGLGTAMARVTVIKRGALGARLFTGDQAMSEPAVTTEPVDTTGAGDAFNAGFLSQWLLGADPRTCLLGGNQRGALAVRTRGGFAPAMCCN